ncbi:MAG: NUDIX hydrolase [Thermoplasmata archaeon]
MSDAMDPRPPWPRPLAICVLREDDKLFVFEGYDAPKDEAYYRPLGGTIEFGEPARQAVERELQEEIEAELTNLRFLGVLENIFTNEGETGHEIVLIFEGDFVNRSLYEVEALEGQEEDGMSFEASWKPLSLFRQGEAPLYPDGLLELLSGDDPADFF